MSQKTIIFVPGKNPKPPANQHHELLWRTLLEGVRRARPTLSNVLKQHADDFILIAWNHLFYQEEKDISRDLPWIDALINKHGPTEQDIDEAKAWHRKLDRALFTLVDTLPFILRFLAEPIRMTVQETARYFQNHDQIATQIREQLKTELRSRLANNEAVMIIGHSLGSVIAYDTLWELSHLEQLPGKVDCLLTLGSPLGMNYVQHRILGNDQKGRKKYPHNIRHWINLSSVGDITALDRVFHDDFADMLKFDLIESIEDHCQGIYNFYHNENGLNCHRSYGYLVNPAVGHLIADWWQPEQQLSEL